jgi:hypothetical protein
MAFINPFAQLVGPVKIYIAPYGTVEPVVTSTPGGAWVELGATDGEQAIENTGELTFFRDNDHTGAVTATRGEEDVIATFTIVTSTLENIARILSNVANVTVQAGPPAIKRLGNKMGANPTEYALLMKGPADSPYGIYPGQNYLPRVVSNSQPKRVRGRGMRQEIACVFHTLEDDAQADMLRLGWATVQTS